MKRRELPDNWRGFSAVFGEALDYLEGRKKPALWRRVLFFWRFREKKTDRVLRHHEATVRFLRHAKDCPGCRKSIMFVIGKRRTKPRRCAIGILLAEDVTSLGPDDEE